MAKKKKMDGIAIVIGIGKASKMKNKEKMMYGGMASGKKHMYVSGGSVTDNLKPVPSGSKGKGLSRLPTSVRNNMGFMQKGGMIKAKKEK